MRVLYVTQEMNPYTLYSEVSELFANLPAAAHEEGFELRILMPKFGNINERRHRLHEVVRLSGMNIIVDDEDYPLIIKVASIPGSRLQVYFLDNEEFFKKRNEFFDDENVAFEDNAERLVFFNKGAVETIRKFGWAPDIIHCHGSFTSLVPLFIKKAYGNDPIFNFTKLIYTAYEDKLSAGLKENFIEIAAIANVSEDDLSHYRTENGFDLSKGAAYYCDGLINATSDSLEGEQPQISIKDNPNHLKDTVDFYHQFITQEVDNE